MSLFYYIYVPRFVGFSFALLSMGVGIGEYGMKFFGIKGIWGGYLYRVISGLYIYDLFELVSKHIIEDNRISLHYSFVLSECTFTGAFQLLFSLRTPSFDVCGDL